MLTSFIDSKEDRYIANIDIPNLSIKTPIDRKLGEEKITMKINRVLVDMLVHMDPEKCGTNVVYEKGNKSLYLKVLKYIYGVL